MSDGAPVMIVFLGVVVSLQPATSNTLTVLSPSPTQISRLSRISTPSGPDVLLFPVAPANCPWPQNPRNVRSWVSTKSTALLVRSPRTYRPIAGSTKLMSNEFKGFAVTPSRLPIVTAAIGLKTSESTCALTTADVSSHGASSAVENVSSLVVLDMLHSLVSFLTNRTDLPSPYRVLCCRGSPFSRKSRHRLTLFGDLIYGCIGAMIHGCFGDMIYGCLGAMISHMVASADMIPQSHRRYDGSHSAI